jgi:hypothetical protein
VEEPTHEQLQQQWELAQESREDEAIVNTQPSEAEKSKEEVLKEVVKMQNLYGCRFHLDEVFKAMQEYASQEVRKALQEQTELRWPTKYEIELEATRHCNDTSFQEQFRVWNEAIEWIKNFKYSTAVQG